MATSSQFIGSKISLTSKSEIRYEGILYSLDLNESTISLAKVRSFGTEDRPTDRPVAPKEEIYEFIIFRGTDIKGIDVVEPPKNTNTLPSGLTQDPAIVEVSHYHSSVHHVQPPIHSLPSTSSSMQIPSSSTAFNIPPPRNYENKSLLADFLGQPNAPPSQGSRKSPGTDAGIQVERKNQNQNNQNNQAQQRRGQNNQRGGGGGGNQRGYNRGGNFQNYRGGHGGRGYNNNYQQHRGGSPRRMFKGIQPQQPTARVTFDAPFDFEKANEEMIITMNKIKIEDGTLGAQSADAAVEDTEKKEEGANADVNVIFYQKDNFFDNISCDALDGSKTRPRHPDWKAERKMNNETFGYTNRGRNNGGGWRSMYPRGFYSNRGYGSFYQRGYSYGGYPYGFNNRYNQGRRQGRGQGQQGGF